jgi:hypothetical protein
MALWMIKKSCTWQGNYWDSYETLGLQWGYTGILPIYWCRISQPSTALLLVGEILGKQNKNPMPC